MGEYTNGDIQRIHDRIDELGANLRSEMKASTVEIVNLAIAMGKVETKLLLMPAQRARPCQELDIHLKDHKEIKRPCPELTEHLVSHKETRTLWQRPLVGALIDVAKILVVAGIFWEIGKYQASKQPEKPQQETRTTAQP